MERAPFAVVIVVAILIAIPAAMIIRQNTKHLVEANLNSPSPSPTDNASPMASSSAILEPTTTPWPATQPTPTPTFKTTSTPQPTPPPQQSNTTSWQYPSSSGSNPYTSSDPPDAITNWYRDKIKAAGMNTTSFVTTNTNGNVLNKLAGAGNGQSISVEIKKNSGESQTTITVKL